MRSRSHVASDPGRLDTPDAFDDHGGYCEPPSFPVPLPYGFLLGVLAYLVLLAAGVALLIRAVVLS